MNWKRWLLVGYLLALMAFTTSVLLIPGEKYDTLTTSDSGFFFGVAREINENNGMVENYSLSHAPYGLPVGITDQGQPLITVMLYRAVNSLNPSVELMDVARYWGPLLFALSLIPIFLIGKELGGDFGGCAAAFFGATLTSSIYWHKVGAFDREPIQLILGAWTIFLTIKLFKAPRRDIPKFALLAGLVYGLFGLVWTGALYIAPMVIGGVLFVLLAGFFGRLIRKTSDVFGAFFSSIRDHLNFIVGAFGMLIVMTLALWVIGGQDPMLWTGFARSLLGYVGIGGGGEGISFARYAGEMAPPNSWDDTIYRMYGSGAAAILTVLVFALIFLALLKFCWSRKRWELLVFPWLIVIAMLVWPGKGQMRFERMWWPFVPALAGVGAAVLVTLIRRLSFEQFGEWLKHFQKPVVIAFSIGLVATPFIFNAYAVAGRSAPPTEWHGAGINEGLMEAFAWLRENTPENSVVSIEWSFGHVLTGTADRATVADGTETMGELGKWENTATIRPPDYIYWVVGNEGKFPASGLDPLYRANAINGRRPDVDRLLYTGDENEFANLLRWYRDNYGCKINYIMFLKDAYYSTRGFNTTWAASSNHRENNGPVTTSDGNWIFTFDNQEVILDPNTRIARIEEDGENKYLAGVMYYYPEVGSYIGPQFYSEPDVSEFLWVILTTGGSLRYGLLSDFTGAPMFYRIFNNFDAPDYVSVAYTSSNGLVKVVEIDHENLP